MSVSPTERDAIGVEDALYSFMAKASLYTKDTLKIVHENLMKAFKDEKELTDARMILAAIEFVNHHIEHR